MVRSTIAVGRRAALQLIAISVGAPFVLTSRQARSADTQIDIIHQFSGADHPMEQVIAAFNRRQTGVNAVGRQEGTSYEAITQKAMAGIASGRPPAVMTTGFKLASFAKQNLGACDIRSFGKGGEGVLANYTDKAVGLVTIGDSVLGIPWALSTPVLYVNMDLWKTAGLDPEVLPVTVEDMYATLSQLQAKTGKPALVYEVNEWLPQAFIQNAGGNVLNDRGEPEMDSPAAIAGVEKYVEPSRKGIWRPIGLSEMLTAFQTGAVGAIATSSARLSGIKAQSSFEIKMAKMPGLEGHQRRMNSGGNFLAILARKPDQQAAAIEFLKFCASAEAMRIWLQTGYLNTTRHSLPIPAGQEQAYAQFDDGLTAETVWPGRRGLEALKAHVDWLSRIVNGAVPVADGLKASKEAVGKLLN